MLPTTSSHTMMRAGLLLWLMALTVLAARAQDAVDYWVHPDYTARQWTTRDGLPANTSHRMIQTSDGYFWISTIEGLARFDGHRFAVFNVANTPGLAGNRIGELLEEPAGYLWIYFELGKTTLYHQGRFTRVGGAEELNASPMGVYADGDTIWVATAQGLAYYADGRLHPYRRDVIDAYVSSIVPDREGRRWVSVRESGLYRFDRDGTAEHVTTEDGLPLLNIIYLVQGHTGGVWAITSSGVVRIAGNQMVHYAPLRRSSWTGVYSHYLDPEGGLWIPEGTKGWWRHDPSGDRTLHPTANPGWVADIMKQGPDGQLYRVEISTTPPVENRIYRGETLIFSVKSGIRTLLFDPTGNLWIMTGTQGLFRLRRALLRSISEAEGLPSRNVYPILEDRRGTIWVGTLGGGLARIDTAMNVSVIEPQTTASGVQVPSLELLSLYEDRSGTVWVNGECRMQGDRCRPFEGPKAVRAMVEDSRGRFWFGHGGGLAVGQWEGGALTWTAVTTASGLPKREAQVITETRDGTLLFGTKYDGLLRYDAELASPGSASGAGSTGSGGLEVFATEDGLPSNRVRDIYEDRENYLWIALEDRGLCRLDRRGRLTLSGADLRCIDTHNGLYHDGLHRILEDDHGRLWFNSNFGIFWVERAELNAYFAGEIDAVSSVSYTEADGMRNREGNGGMQPAGIRARDGRFWFPTQDGVVIIDPDQVPVPEPPPVRLETVRVGEEVRWARRPLTLGPGRRDVMINYAAIEFTRPEDVRFQYALDGYNDQWQDVGEQRVAVYTNLGPGAYTFRVRAGLGGVWGAAATLEIERQPHFWETTWFYALLVLAFAFTGPSIYLYRVRRLKAREAALEQIVTERTAELRRANELKSHFLANISHEFRTPLTLTFGPLDDLLAGRYASLNDARPRLQQARRNGNRLLRLINQLLDLSKLDAGALMLHARRHDLGLLLRQITAMFDSYAASRGIALVTEIPETPEAQVFDADKIEKVITNLLSNAFKFTPSGGKISVIFERDAAGAARIVVADTGPGIAQEHLAHLFDRFYQVDGTSTRAQEGTGIGLALVKELVELHEGAIDVESTVGFGTRFTVVLPPLDGEEALEHAVEGVRADVLDAESGPAAQGQPQVDQRALDLAALDIATVVSDSLDPSEIQTPKSKIDDTVVLVVEDNADMRSYIREHLEASFTVVEAENGKVGVERALALVPDLVLSDVMMPEMDGLEACAAIKADERTSHIPVVLLTAKAAVEHRIAGFESGADAYLPKPFNAEELLVRVRTLIAERRRLRARFAERAGAVEPEPEAAVPALPAREAAFLEKVQAQVEAHLSDTHFGVDRLAEELLMSRRQLFRKLDALIEETPAALIRRMRLARAAALLRQEAVSVKEVCFAVGFQSNSSFARAFRQVYGVSPSEYSEQGTSS